jgi:hypothetical protein
MILKSRMVLARLDTPLRAACRMVGVPKYGESRNGVLHHRHGRDARAPRGQ